MLNPYVSQRFFTCPLLGEFPNQYCRKWANHWRFDQGITERHSQIPLGKVRLGRKPRSENIAKAKELVPCMTLMISTHLA
jgi:hypothetical protein